MRAGRSRGGAGPRSQPAKGQSARARARRTISREDSRRCSVDDNRYQIRVHGSRASARHGFRRYFTKVPAYQLSSQFASGYRLTHTLGRGNADAQHACLHKTKTTKTLRLHTRMLQENRNRQGATDARSVQARASIEHVLRP